jgi:pimeloyl-ACP methyl ester carboxylesterase
MKRLTTQTAELEFEVWGQGEPVLLIDGALITDTFRPILAEPGVAGRYRPIIYHRRGYGSSSQAWGTVSVAAQAADCRDLLDHLGVERAHIVGHSYGGAIALQLALDAPAAVASLAVLEPALTVGASGQGYREGLTRNAERYRQAGASIVVDEFLEARWPGYRSALERVLPGAFTQAVSDAATWFEHELPGLLEWEFGEAQAGRIAQRALAVLGGNSQSLGPRFRETYEFLLTWMPHAEGFVLPGASHLMQFERPLALAAALTAFWARHALPTDPSVI